MAIFVGFLMGLDMWISYGIQWQKWRLLVDFDEIDVPTSASSA